MIPSDQYLDEALNLSDSEQSILTDLNAWLPDTIIDCHSHTNGADAVGDLPDIAYRRLYSSFPGFSIEQSQRVKTVFHPSKTIYMLRFANPYKGIKHKIANDYLLKCKLHGDQVALLGLPDDPAYTLEQLQSTHYVALKSYPFYFDPPAKTVLEYFTPEMLAACERLAIPIILHLPLPLADCLDEVLHIAQTYPALTIVIAHLGRHRVYSEKVLEAYKTVKHHQNIVMDTSMIATEDVMIAALEILGMSRIMYGSDEPMNLHRYVSYMHPQLGERFMSQYPYHWLDDSQRAEYGHLAENALLLHLQCLLVLKSAMTKVFSPDELDVAKHSIFYKNASMIFDWNRM